MRVLGLLLMCCLLALEIPTASGQEPERSRPNILIIVTDDQRAGLEVMPAARAWFRRRGTTYRPGFATTPMCCPARASIMTGRYAHNHGVKSNGGRSEPGLEALDHSTTIQAYLNEEGYRTGLIGKFLNGGISRTPPSLRYMGDDPRSGGLVRRPFQHQWDAPKAAGLRHQCAASAGAELHPE